MSFSKMVSLFGIFARHIGIAILGNIGIVVVVCLSACTPAERSTASLPKADSKRVTLAVPAKMTADVEDPRLRRLDEVAKQEMMAGHIAGAVILVGHRGKIVYRKAFGHRTLRSGPEAMEVDTVFDLASLTKVVATTTAIMQLVENKKLDLDQPVARYWPDFNKNAKQHITLRQLLTHTSGLRAEVYSKVRWSGYEGALQAIATDKPIKTPGSAFRYSDANFIALGEVVRRVSGLPLDEYCRRHVFAPMGLTDTVFKPRLEQRERIAPSDVRWGEVQDPTAYRMGGVAGNAGLFSTADDLAVFARMLLDGGIANGRRILSERSVAALHEPFRIPGSSTLRGLGWDMYSPYSKDHTNWFPKGSFGHTGYTGTSLWLDPESETYLIVLTSRLYPDGKGNARPLRAKAAEVLAAALPMGESAIAASTGSEPLMPGAGQADDAERVRTGIDVLEAEGFAPLIGKKIGVISNHSGINAAGDSTIDLLRRAPGVDLKAIFSPEHGLTGTRDEKIASSRDASSGLPIYSLYGDVKRPKDEMLTGLDALVYDIQDVGVRFYTYITTMAYAMEAAASAGLEFYVLDRPNPISAAIVEGPVMEPGLRSFIGYFPLPLRYGMTAGELAALFNQENHIGAKLHVIKMQGYQRHQWFDDSGLHWINPSPNIRSLTQAILYTGVGSVESANLSVGRGTDTPFEVVGAPWISGRRLADYLAQRKIPGIEFEPESFTPKANPYRAKRCEGVRLRLTDRDAFDGSLLGIELASALHRLYPDVFAVGRIRNMLGSALAVDAIKRGLDPRDIRLQWQPGLDQFLATRAKYLLY
ncbi:MAG: exo-beta-N-acetylmuramidase NamZ domain-containing protein [Gammaproteobacteria bacterium]